MCVHGTTKVMTQALEHRPFTIKMFIVENRGLFHLLIEVSTVVAHFK